MLYDRSNHYSQSHKAMVTTTIPKLTAYVNAHLDQTEQVQQPQRHHQVLIFPVNCLPSQDLSCSSLSIPLTSQKLNAV